MPHAPGIFRIGNIRLTAAAGLLLLVLISPALAQEPPPALTTPPAPPVGLTAEEATALARSLAPRVEELRGLTFRSQVPVKVVNDAFTAAQIKERAKKFWPEDRVRAEQTAFAQLGLLPPGTNLVTSLFDVLEEQVGGFYNPDDDTFYVLDDMPASLGPIIMVHELTHALDDQYFKIDDILQKSLDDDDRSEALGAVVEGSGTVVMTAYLVREIAGGRVNPQVLLDFQKTEAGKAEKLMAAPAFLQRGLLSPYLLGQGFLLRGNLSAVASGVRAADLDRAFKDPPVSSEQILHPEKYWNDASRDLPLPIASPDLSRVLGEGWTRWSDGNLGELNIALLTGAGPMSPTSPETLSAAGWTNIGAAGWGADRWQLYKNGETTVAILLTIWDTEKDAQEFETALKPLEGRTAQRRGDSVVLVAGASQDQAGRLIDKMLDAQPKRKGRKPAASAP